MVDWIPFVPRQYTLFVLRPILLFPISDFN